MNSMGEFGNGERSRSQPFASHTSKWAFRHSFARAAAVAVWPSDGYVLAAKELVDVS